MSLDAVFLSRLQFFWVIALHILLPAFTVGLAAYVAVLEGLYFFTERSVYLRLSKFWLKIFAVSFGTGVVSGIVMPFQFGTNWSRYSEGTAFVPLRVGDGDFCAGTRARNVRAGDTCGRPPVCGHELRMGDAVCLVDRAGLVIGYALIGVCWLVMKTEGSLHDWARRKD